MSHVVLRGGHIPVWKCETCAARCVDVGIHGVPGSASRLFRRGPPGLLLPPPRLSQEPGPQFARARLRLRLRPCG